MTKFHFFPSNLKVIAIFFVVITLFLEDCQYSRSSDSAKEDNKTIAREGKYTLMDYYGQKAFTISKELPNHDCRLVINTIFLNDTLSVTDWKEDVYSHPIIQSQELVFYTGKTKIKSLGLPIKFIYKKTIHNEAKYVTSIPILELCLLKGTREDFYLVYGADFCNGAKCPEFIGVYNQRGEIIYENISTIGQISKPYGDWQSIKKKFGVDFGKEYNCVNTHDFWEQ